MSTTVPLPSSTPYDVVVLGAGYAGLMAALRLSPARHGLRIALVNANPEFVERVRLQESLLAPVPSRTGPLARYLAKTAIEFIEGTVTALDLEQRTIHVAVAGGNRIVAFDQAIYALGSVVDVDSVPGAADHTFRLDPGPGPRAAAALRERLHAGADQPLDVVVVGGGPLSVEAAAEIKTAWPHMQVTLLSATRTGAFQNAKVEHVVRRDLSRLGVALVDHESVAEVRAGQVVGGSGQIYPADISIWAGGMRAPALAQAAGISVGSKGRVLVGPDLRSISHPFVLAVGDSAIPTGPTGAPYRLSALTAAVSGVYAADQVLSRRSGKALPPFSFSTFAQAIAIGRYAVLFGLNKNDQQALFVIGGAVTKPLRSVLIWLVFGFIALEKALPGVQTWPGRKRLAWGKRADQTVETSKRPAE